MNLTVIGDDLTGTVDCVSLGVRAGCRVRVAVEPDADFSAPDPDKREILGINMASRTLPGKQAYQIARQATAKVRNGPKQVILKKMDTGFRGNAAYEIEGMLEELQKKYCFIMEHIPIRKTFTLYGYQYSGGQILNKSVFARDDRLKAPTEAYIPAILAKDTSLPIGTVDIDAVKGGDIKAAVAEQIKQGKRIIVFDAITYQDSMRAVSLLQPIYPDAIWAGSTGIVETLIAYLYGPLSPTPVHAQDLRCICFSGTAYEATKKQIQYAQQNAGLVIVDLDIDRLLAQDNAAFEEAMNQAEYAYRGGSNILIRQRLSPEREFAGVDQVILNALVRAAHNLCTSLDFDRLVVVGGETSQAIFRALDITILDMADPVEIGTGFGKIESGPLAGKSFAIKGGSIGSEEVLIKMMGRWDGICQQ